jgi:GntR family transcriptional regulator
MRIEKNIMQKKMINLEKFRIEKGTPIPLYYQLKQFLISEIKSGRIQPGDYIPAEQDLVDQLGISRTTIRQTLSEMANEGYLLREKSKGTVITRPKIDEQFLQLLESFNNEMRSKGLSPSTRVLSLQKVAAREKVRANLGLAEGDELIYLERLRFADNDPIVYLETYLPYNRFSALLKEDFERNSLYDLLEKNYKLSITRAVRRIEAVAATAKESAMLAIEKNAPICLVRTTAFDNSGKPVEYSIARYRGDRNEFTIELKRL